MSAANRPFNSWDMVKVIALLFMFIDHAGAYFFIHEQWIRSIGRGAAPIYLFLAGYSASYRFNRELLGLACLMTLSNLLMGEYTHPLNILFTILICRAVFDWLHKHGRKVEKPVEWFVACALFAVLTCFLVQYGTLGMMFALAGYMQRRPADYSPRLRFWFFVGMFVIYALTFELFFDLSAANFALMLPVLYVDYLLLLRLEIRELNMQSTPQWAVALLALSSRYSGYIYAIHLIVISWITHMAI